MSYKPEESTLIAYLYGELSVEERAKVKQYLEAHPDATAELEQLQATRSIMGHLRDKEVPVPTFTFDDSSRVVVGRKSNIFTGWRLPLAIAASLSLLFLVGYLTKLNVEVGGGNLSLSFGASDAQEYSSSEVQAMIQEALDQNNQVLNERFANAEDQLELLAAQKVSETNQQVEKQLASFREETIETLTELMVRSEQAQRKYTEETLVDLAIYWDIQRQNDLELIQTQFNNVVNDAAFNQEQTNLLLTNLMTSVGSEPQPTNQY